MLPAASNVTRPPTLTPTKTAARSTPRRSQRTHVFLIDKYSLHKGLGQGEFIQSGTFNIGGYTWCIRYYPNGDSRKESTDHISVYLELLTVNAEVRATYDLRLMDQCTGLAFSILCSTEVFSNKDLRENIFTWGGGRFMKKSVLEAKPSKYLRDDRLVIHCEITTFKVPQVAVETTAVEVRVPPSDLHEDFGKLLESGEGADVTFRVRRDVFPAHRMVLAARSPVFNAQLYGPVGEDNRECITIEDIQPGIFKALLHFAYTDSLPDMKDIELDEIHEEEDIVKHLLVAADKYAMERLKLVCSDMLCKSLDIRTVVSTLALADLHSCHELRRACIEYIMASGRARDVVASPGFQLLREACPTVFADLWEKSIKSV